MAPIARWPLRFAKSCWGVDYPAGAAETFSYIIIYLYLYLHSYLYVYLYVYFYLCITLAGQIEYRIDNFGLKKHLPKSKKRYLEYENTILKNL